MFPVKKIKKKKNVFDSTSPELFYMKPARKKRKIYDVNAIGRRLESSGSLRAEDVVHAFSAGSREIRDILVSGDKVKIEGLGIFYLTFNCEGTAEEKDCTVRKIYKVNVRFIADKALRLINNANAQTRSDNGVEFYLEKPTDKNPADDNGTGSDDDDDGNPTM